MSIHKGVVDRLVPSQVTQVMLSLQSEIHEPSDNAGVGIDRQMFSDPRHGSQSSQSTYFCCVEVVQFRLKNDVSLAWAELADGEHDDRSDRNDGDDCDWAENEKDHCCKDYWIDECTRL